MWNEWVIHIVLVVPLDRSVLFSFCKTLYVYTCKARFVINSPEGQSGVGLNEYFRE